MTQGGELRGKKSFLLICSGFSKIALYTWGSVNINILGVENGLRKKDLRDCHQIEAKRNSL